MAHDTNQGVREICLWLPEAEEFQSHGAPNFRVRGKTFATYVVNHHGDGRVALWLPAVPGAQEAHVRSNPKYFFVPPYVGVRGWLGVVLDKGVSWKVVAALVRAAYEKVAPSQLTAQLAKTPAFKVPAKLSQEEVDPFKTVRAVAVLTRLRKLCLTLPETSAGVQFGHPVWAAGKKTFVIARFHERKLTLCFWVGAVGQSMLIDDVRYSVPPYMGHNGWIALDVSKSCDWKEVEGLLLQSYRHFALKRMRRLMGEG
jgi:predicted DNA-binding protein (MmcQ/YjbR family)